MFQIVGGFRVLVARFGYLMANVLQLVSSQEVQCVILLGEYLGHPGTVCLDMSATGHAFQRINVLVGMFGEQAANL